MKKMSSSDNKTYKDKIKSRYLKKKQSSNNNNNSNIKKKPEIKKVQKISEKYLKEEKSLEKSLEIHEKKTSGDDDYAKQKQVEVDFFCDPFSSVPIDSSKDSISLNGSEKNGNDSIKSEVHSHSSHSNGSPNTHLASTYIGQENAAVIEKFELTRIIFDDAELFRPSSDNNLNTKIDADKMRYLKDEGIFTPDKPKLNKSSNKFLLLNRLHESRSTEFIDGSGDLKNFEKLVTDDVYRLVSERKFTPIYVPPTPMNFHQVDKIIFEQKFLKIFISRLIFEHHHLFTNEHHLANIVEKLFTEFERRKKLDLCGTLRNKLEYLRQLKAENFPQSDGQKSARIIRNEEITLNSQIKSVRSKLHVEEKYDHIVMKNLLENWKNLKATRAQQKYSFTNVAFKIQKLEKDSLKTKTEWQQQYDAELNEMIAENFEEYQQMKQKYKEFIKSNSEPSSIMSDENESIKKPRKPDIDKIVAQLNKIYDGKHFNEPEINVFITHDGSTDNNEKPKEKLKKFSKFSYRIELEIDSEIVGSTKNCKLEEDFSIPIQSAFILKLTKQLPEKIKLLIFEVKRINRKLAEILIPLPDDESLFSDSTITDFDFSSKRLGRRNSRFSSLRQRSSRKLVNISGKISVQLGWTKNGNDQIEGYDVDIIKKHETRLTEQNLSQSVLKKWFDEKLLNPMDPDASNLVKYVNQSDILSETHSNGQQSVNDLFRFNEEELAFCSKEEFQNNERFQLLIARSSNEIDYKNKKMVPQHERELDLEKDRDTNIIDETTVAEPIDLQRFKGRRYLSKVYDIITNHCENLNRDKMNTNILIGDEFPTFGSLSLAFLEMFGPKRPLKPRRATSSRTSCKINEISNFKIMVTVVRANNVPVRSDEPTQPSSRKSSNMSISHKFTPFKTINSHPFVFVTISLKEQTCRTTTAEGTNPVWNEQLSLPFNINSDQPKRVLSIDLYDEVVEDLTDNVTEVYQRISCKWLGSLKIPVANIYNNQRIEGTFEVQTPQVLLGYTKPKFSPADQTTIAIDNLPDMSKKTHISLFINLEPNVEIPKLISTGLECIEVDHVEMHIKLWYEQLKLDFPLRAKNPLVTLLNGKRACITRLVYPLPFPFEKTDVTEFQIRRFVSLIPVHHDASSNNSCSGLGGVWLSNNHILSLLASSSKDLGVLLACYYLELGIAAWLILGNSISCGECCFVLVKQMSEFFIIDPISGKMYNSKDIYCPLTTCYCLVNQYNVWANVQRESRVFMTQFDVNRGFDWRPLFQRVVDIPNGTIHELNFRYERSLDTKDLQRTIQAKIIKKINSWRSHRKTIWNRYIIENLKSVLVKLEDDICLENESNDHAEMLKSLFVNYKITGYTINTKYTTLSAIVNDVKNTGIHLNLDNKVEFASSVFVKEYANNVLSIWIFLMSLVPKT